MSARSACETYPAEDRELHRIGCVVDGRRDRQPRLLQGNTVDFDPAAADTLQFELFADRAFRETLAGNQLRLMVSEADWKFNRGFLVGLGRRPTPKNRCISAQPWYLATVTRQVVASLGAAL